MQYISGSLGHTSTAEENLLWTQFNNDLRAFDGTFGYRLPSVGMSSNETPSFVIHFYEKGILLIDVISESIARVTDDNDEYWLTSDGKTMLSRDIVIDNFEREVETRLKSDGRVFDRKSKELKVTIKKILVFCNTSEKVISKLNLINEHVSQNNLLSHVRSFIEQHNNTKFVSDVAQSLIEGTKVLVRKRKVAETHSETITIGSLIEKSIDNTFTLDEEQRKVSMQIPQGPQRIRGLAGTGKTVILALKAALTHKEDGKLSILSVFNTQSMYNQIYDLVTKYYAYETKTTPDWSKLEIMHAWGGRGKQGFYYSVCKRFGFPPFSYGEVRGLGNAMEYIFSDLLKKLKVIKPEPIYDMVLVDEAQDFPQPFFEVIFLLTKPPKRIVWAYDEFQSLNELTIREPKELFGLNSDNKPNMPNSDLSGVYLGGIEKDFILSNSYRNPRITLMTAHGLGLGIYRKEGIVDIVADRNSWVAIGYAVNKPTTPTLKEGDVVEIERPERFSKNTLEKILKEKGLADAQLVSFKSYPDGFAEYRAVARNIHHLITKQDIAPEQIVVISLASANLADIFTMIRQELDFLGIKSITPGFIEATDMFQEEGFVTLVTPFRAKGNEANIVFVIDAQHAVNNASLRSRNAVFVSITRSRGYCYVSGHGPRIDALKVEYDSILRDYPKFKFTFPNKEELSRRRVILNKTDNEMDRAQRQIEELMSKNQELLIETLRLNPDFLNKILENKKDDSDQ